MTIKVELDPETEALLAARARVEGVPAEELARKLLNDALSASSSSNYNATTSEAFSVEEFHEMLKGIAQGSDDLPSLPTESFSRESFYEGRLDASDAVPRR